jgi:Tfp pilus assembly protein PilP
MLLAACAGDADSLRVEVEGSACDDQHDQALDSYVASAEAEPNAEVASDQCNSDFEAAEDQVSGQTDAVDVQQEVCDGAPGG